jgi:hypothetical protein
MGAGVRSILLSPRVHVDIGGRGVLFWRSIILRRGRSLFGCRQRCRRQRGSMASGRYVRACRRHRLVYVGASTGARSTFRCKWSPEKEKSKLASRRRGMSEII